LQGYVPASLWSQSFRAAEVDFRRGRPDRTRLGYQPQKLKCAWAIPRVSSPEATTSLTRRSARSRVRDGTTVVGMVSVVIALVAFGHHCWIEGRQSSCLRDPGRDRTSHPPRRINTGPGSTATSGCRPCWARAGHRQRGPRRSTAFPTDALTRSHQDPTHHPHRVGGSTRHTHHRPSHTVS